MSLAVKLLKTAYKNAARLKSKPKTENLASLFEKRTSQARRTYSAVAAQGTSNSEQVVLKEHGLSEIMSEAVHKPTQIGQTPVYSPLKPELPEHYIKVEGQIIPCERDVRGKVITDYKIVPSKDNPNLKYVHFIDKEGHMVGARIPVERTSKMTRTEYIKYLDDLKKNPRPQVTTPTEPQETWLEKTIKGLKAPNGTTKQIVKLDDDGNTIVRFLDKDGYFIRKVKINPDGHVLEYSNYRTMVSSQGMKDAHLSYRYPNGSTCSSRPGEQLIGDAKFDEKISNYMHVKEESRYILDSKGEVARSIQTRRFTPHEYGRVSETSVITTVDSRSMGGGRFVEDVVITKGDKRFSRSYWFDQKSGNVHTMDGWCKGLTKEEIELIKSDPYLASRYYNDPLDFIRAEKFNGYKTQGLRDKSTPLTFDPPNGSESGYYQHGRDFGGTILGRRINVTPSNVSRDDKPWMVNILHHEPRHGYQCQMVDDLNAGLLQGEEKAQAEIFRNNFRNYTSPDLDHARYMAQPVEADAYRIGDAAQKQFVDNGKKIDSIFFDVA
mgnify:CR=1 FL=1